MQLMHIEVDQSPRIEETNRPSVVAFSNGIWSSVYVSAKNKKRLIKLLRVKRKNMKVAKAVLFAVLIYLLVENIITTKLIVDIDLEYPGYEGEIKAKLTQLARKNRKKLLSDQITFRAVGKKSSAHQKAWQTYRKKLMPKKVLSFEEVEKFL